MALYLIANGPMQTTASFAEVTTGTNIKTMLQVKPSSTIGMTVVDWGISFDGTAANEPIQIELIETDVAATVTAHAASGITKYDAKALMGGDPTTNLIQVGTTSTGYTSSGEGSITTVRNLAPPIQLTPTAGMIYQLPLGREPFVQVDKFMRIRVKAANAVNCYCYVIVEI